jgi:hypothetical protein
MRSIMSNATAELQGRQQGRIRTKVFEQIKSRRAGYSWLLLRGLSGIVILINPASINGFSTWSLNLVRLDRPNAAIDAAVPCTSTLRCGKRTWSLLSLDLVPPGRIASSSQEILGSTIVGQVILTELKSARLNSTRLVETVRKCHYRIGDRVSSVCVLDDC